MSDLATLYIKVDSSGVVTASRDLDKLTGASKQAENETKKATESINAHYVKMAAAIGTAMLAVKAAWKFAELGASYEEQRGVLDNLAAKYNTTADRIVESMRRASDEMVAKSELMRIALGGIAKGLNPDQLTNLSNAAKILADTTGTTTTNALNKLTEALEANRIRGVIKLAGANVDLGDTFGKLESKMTAAQKTQALYLLLIQYTNGLQAQQKKQVSGVADEMERLKAEYADATLEIGKMAMNLVVWANAARKGIMEIVTLNPNRYAKVKDALANTGELSVEKTAENIKKQIADLIKEINAGQKNIKLGGVSKSKTKDDTEKLLDAKYKRELELAKANYDAEEDMRKDAEAGAKTTTQGIMAIEKERSEAARILYGDMEGYEQEFYDESIKLIDADVQRFKNAELDKTAIQKYEEEKRRLAQLQKDRTGEGGGFLKGWAQGASDWSKEVGNSFKQAEKMANTTATSMQTGFSNLFFDAFTGEMKSFEDYWKGFTNSILKAFSDMLAEMLVRWILTQLKMKSGGDNEMGWVGTAIGWGKSLLGMFGSSGGGGTSGLGQGDYGSMGNVNGASDYSFMSYHNGGIVGESAYSRLMPAYAFAGARRYHSGLLPDEFPAVLQKGEGVFTKKQMAAMGNQSITVNVPISGIDNKKMVADLKNSIESTVVSVIKRHS